jgi:hypothetical protein
MMAQYPFRRLKNRVIRANAGSPILHGACPERSRRVQMTAAAKRLSFSILI